MRQPLIEPSASALPALGAYADLDDSDVLAALRQRTEALNSHIAWLRQARRATTIEHAHVIFDYELSRHEADLTWTHDFLNRRTRAPESKEEK